MIRHTDFQTALPYAEFLDQYGQAADKASWDQFRSQVALTDGQKKLLAAFTRKTDILFLAGAWCGDCAFQCALVEQIAGASPLLSVRYVDRDDRADLQKELQINGGNRVPVAVFFSEDGFEVARFGEKTLSEYRRLAANVLPPGTVPAVPDRVGAAVAEWVDVIERVQWTLRLSARLRKLHGD